MSYTKEKGKAGEQYVVQYLQKHGYCILHQNYRFFTGEIDIIAQKHDTVAFVEVKWRNNPLVDPTEVITLSKQKKIISIAKRFIAQHTDKQDIIYRFDVALTESDNSSSNNSIKIRYITNAFSTFE